MNIHQPTFELGLQVWWSYFWRVYARCIPMGLFFGFAMWTMTKTLDLQIKAALITTIVFGLILGVVLSAMVVLEMLEKGFGKLQLALVRHSDTQLLDPSIPRALQIWWAHHLRTILLSIPVYILFLFVVLMFMFSFDIPPDGLRPICRTIGFILSQGCSAFIITVMLERGFGNMRLIVIDRMED